MSNIQFFTPFITSFNGFWSENFSFDYFYD